MSLTASRGVPESPDATHPIAIGKTVAVLGFDATGRPFFEGRAITVARAPGPHRYFVHFANDPPNTVLERFAHPEYQEAPEAYLTWMIEFWLACAPASISDFYPEELSP